MTYDKDRAPLYRSLKRLRGSLWRRRFLRGVVRTAWLVLLFPTALKAGQRWLSWSVNWQTWAYAALLVGLVSFLWSVRPIGLVSLVRRMDERLRLRNRMVTAFEVARGRMGEDQAHSGTATDAPPADNPVVARLLGEAVQIAILIRRRIGTFGLGFWLELQALLAIVSVFAGLMMLDLIEPDIPGYLPEALPAAWREPTAEEVLPPDPTLFPPPFAEAVPAVQALPEQALQEGLAALADALRDQAITRAIAEALDRGDLGEAASGLRRLADQLGDLSAQARDGLGQALGAAADEMGEGVPGLGEAVADAGDALRGGSPAQASQSLEELAEALDALEDAPRVAGTQPGSELGQDGQGDEPSAASDASADPGSDEGETGQEGAGAGDEGAGAGGDTGSDQPTEAERLAVEGQPLELESDPAQEERVLQPAELDADGDGERAQDSPFARQPANAAIGDLGPDPLAYPWDKRDVVRRYFSP